jgi:hypothetical protein
MPRRIEVELTSTREDGTWTWRAAGAREPKGTLDGGLLPSGAKVGDVLRADADFDVEGIVITGVLPPKGARKEPERLELLGAPVRQEDLVTSTLVEKKRGGRDGRRGRSDRDDRGGDRDGGRGERRPRPPRRDGEGGEARRESRPRADRRPTRPAPEPKPKPKRLRPGRTHRSAVLASLPEEERPIAEQVVRGGVPAVRQAVDKQNEQAKAEGQPEVKAEPLVAIAERLLPRIKEAEWHDRADAAIASLDDLDLRDLRSVVVASDTGARDDETKALADQLREGLNRRVEQEHAAWLAELDETLTDGRVVRALRLSSRPPKAGAPLPSELSTRLADAAGAAFGPEITQERWATVLDAVAYSPVRQAVTPAAVPAEPSDDLLAAVRKLASRVPEIASKLGVTTSDAPSRSRRPRKASAKGASKPAPIPPPPPTDAASTAAPADEPAAPVADEAQPKPEVQAEPAQAEPAQPVASDEVQPEPAQPVASDEVQPEPAPPTEPEPEVQPEAEVQAVSEVQPEPASPAESETEVQPES